MTDPVELIVFDPDSDTLPVGEPDMDSLGEPLTDPVLLRVPETVIDPVELTL